MDVPVLRARAFLWVIYWSWSDTIRSQRACIRTHDHLPEILTRVWGSFTFCFRYRCSTNAHTHALKADAFVIVESMTLLWRMSATMCSSVVNETWNIRRPYDWWAPWEVRQWEERSDATLAGRSWKINSSWPSASMSTVRSMKLSGCWTLHNARFGRWRT